MVQIYSHAMYKIANLIGHQHQSDLELAEINMFTKVITLTAILACSQALELNHATSYSSINTHITPVAKLELSPVLSHVAHVAHVAPIAHVAHVAPVAHIAHVAPVKTLIKEVYADSHPQYSFEYGVKDSHTNDNKNQQEQRDGDVVKGSYSLLQPDGVTRTVHYSADDHNGFNAQVDYSGHAAHPQKVLVAKAVLATPVYHH